MKKQNKIAGLIATSLLLLIFIVTSSSVFGLPSGPTVTLLGNSTSVISGPTKVNSTNDSRTPGGFIFTTLLSSTQQNTKWKGYVGNVTGTLALDDALGNTLFQWSLTTVTGEVYATRSSSNVNWSGINCTWHGESGIGNYVDSNRTIEEIENFNLNHTGKEDNITATFARANHSQLLIGSVTVPKNACFAVQTWQNDAAQAFLDSDTANFSQIILYDSTNNSVDRGAKTYVGNVVYTTKIHSDITGYRPGSVYDFQMILPENGLSSFTSSTPYYFYVELS